MVSLPVMPTCIARGILVLTGDYAYYVQSGIVWGELNYFREVGGKNGFGVIILVHAARSRKSVSLNLEAIFAVEETVKANGGQKLYGPCSNLRRQQIVRSVRFTFAVRKSWRKVFRAQNLDFSSLLSTYMLCVIQGEWVERSLSTFGGIAK